MMPRFTIRHLLLFTTFVIGLILAVRCYHSWKYSYSVTNLDVFFSVDGQRLKLVDGCLQVPASVTSRRAPITMHWLYDYENNDGTGNGFGNDLQLHADDLFGGIHLRRTSSMVASQNAIDASGLSSYFFWSSEVLPEGCVVYASVQVCEGGRVVDTSFSEFRLAREVVAE